MSRARLYSALLRHDVRFQMRSGFYAAYLFVGLSYIVLLRVLPAHLRGLVLAPVLLSEASVVGFFFAGALLHFERGDGVLQALGVTPISTPHYLIARAISLTLLTTLLAVLLALAAGVPGVHPLTLALAAALTALFFALLGMAVASRFDGIDRFVVLGGLVSALFGLPVFPYFGLMDSPLWRVLPTDAALRLLAAGLGARGVAGVGAAVWLMLWIGAAGVLARHWVERHAMERTA